MDIVVLHRGHGFMFQSYLENIRNPLICPLIYKLFGELGEFVRLTIAADAPYATGTAHADIAIIDNDNNAMYAC